MTSADDLQRLLTELTLKKDDVNTLMAMADSDGDGVISFGEFKAIMHATQRPNPITRVSMMSGRMSGISDAVPMDTGAGGRSYPGGSYSQMSDGVGGTPASPVHSLMNAMEAKWMSGRMASLPRAISKAIHVPFRNKRQQMAS